MIFPINTHAFKFFSFIDTLIKIQLRSSCCGAKETNPTGLHGCRFDPWPLSVAQGSSIPMSCGVGRRHDSDPVLLWLWCGPAAVTPVWSLAWELPYAARVALKQAKKRKKKKATEKKLIFPFLYSFQSIYSFNKHLLSTVFQALDRTLGIQRGKMQFLKFQFLKDPFPLAVHFKGLSYAKYQERNWKELE